MLHGLNAPYGARCFLTQCSLWSTSVLRSLNAPYGARCFLTDADSGADASEAAAVLMHLMALGAF